MRKVILVSDSAMDLPAEYIEKEEIVVVPFHISFNEETYRDGLDINTERLYEKVKELGVLPKSAAISPEEWLTFFKPIVDAGHDVFCLTIGSKLSSSFQNAYIASLEFESGRVCVLDSETLSGSIAILMLKAADMRREGMSAKEIKEGIAKLIPNMHTQFVIQTFDYLYKGGRCGAMSMIVGTVLSIKPQIKIFDGKLDVHKKTPGKMSRAVDVMLKDFFDLYDEGKIDPDYVFITHSPAEKMAVHIKERLNEKGVTIKNLIESYSGSVISTHCGPGTIGILYLEK